MSSASAGSERVVELGKLVDETYLKFRGRWTYLYRAIDRDGNLIEVMLSEHRYMGAPRPSSIRPGRQWASGRTG